jgi:hypothetical protein
VREVVPVKNTLRVYVVNRSRALADSLYVLGPDQDVVIERGQLLS